MSLAEKRCQAMLTERQGNMTTFYADTQSAEVLHPEALLAHETVYVYRQATALGVVAGLRSMLPFAIIAREPATSTDDEAALARFLHAPGWQQATLIAATLEMVADKLPFASSRLRTGSLLTRLAIGAAAGALLCRRSQRPAITGAMLGAAGAGLGSVAGYSGRMLLWSFTNTPDFVWGLLEDGIALGLGWLVVSKNRAVNAKKLE